MSRLCYLFAHLHLLSSGSFSSDLLSSNLSLLSASALLCFSSVHIVGSLASELPSIIVSVYTLLYRIIFPTSLCGVLVFDSVSRSSSSSSSSLSAASLSHTIFHTQLCHTPLCHTHTQLCHTSSFTHNFVTHNFVTHNFVCHTQLCHTQTLSHILQHKPSPTHHLSTQTFSHSAWQAWHLVTSTFHLRGRRGTWRRLRRGKHGACGTGLALVARLGRRGTLRSRRGACAPSTFAHPPSVCVAGVALGEMYLRLAWQVWHLWHWAGSGGVLGRRVSHSPGAPRHFAWRAWHSAALTPHLCGSRGTWWHLPAFGVAGVALVTGGALGRR